MQNTKLIVSVILILSILGPLPELSSQDKKLLVGTKEAPPFSFRDETGAWRGLSIELWQTIMDTLQLDYSFVDMELQELLDGLQEDRLDAAIAALTITEERESSHDFTHPYFVTGLSIAVPNKQGWSFLSFARLLITPGFLKVILLLALLILLIGAAVWLFERKKNPGHFGGGRLEGLISGFWWSAVTMTTVGYGDKAPGTIGGRLVGFFWMFASIIIISSFTAAITSHHTIIRLQGLVNGPQDLQGARVVTVTGSTSSDYLTERSIPFQPMQDLHACLEVLAQEEVDAVVYDEPIMRFRVKQEFSRAIHVLPITFETQYYGIMLHQGSALREPINRALLKVISEPHWQRIKKKYLGS